MAAQVADGMLSPDVEMEALMLLTLDLADITGKGERLVLCKHTSYILHTFTYKFVRT